MEQDSRWNCIHFEPPGQLASIVSTTEMSSHLCVRHSWLKSSHASQNHQPSYRGWEFLWIKATERLLYETPEIWELLAFFICVCVWLRVNKIIMVYWPTDQSWGLADAATHRVMPLVWLKIHIFLVPRLPYMWLLGDPACVISFC